MSKFERVVYTTGITTGTTVTSGASTASAAVPNDSTGKAAGRVMLVSTATVHVKFGGSGVTATANDLMVGTTPIVVNCQGNSNFAYIQETAAAKLNVSPVEE